MSDLFGPPRPGFGWARPSPVESQPVRDDDMPVVLVAGLGAGWPPQVRLDLVAAWRELGRPIVVAVSVWDARSQVGQQARRFAAEHAVSGIRWQPCVTRPDRVDRVLAYDGVRRPDSLVPGGGMSIDKRAVCGCHRGCDEPAWWLGSRPQLSHVCSGQCEWPACLTAAEHDELAREVEEDML